MEATGLGFGHFDRKIGNRLSEQLKASMCFTESLPEEVETVYFISAELLMRPYWLSETGNAHAIKNLLGMKLEFHNASS